LTIHVGLLGPLAIKLKHCTANNTIPARISWDEWWVLLEGWTTASVLFLAETSAQIVLYIHHISVHCVTFLNKKWYIIVHLNTRVYSLA